MTSSTGSFVSPNYPLPYGRNAECVWNITVSQGSTVRLHFIDLETEQHSSCNFDYVEVYLDIVYQYILPFVYLYSLPEVQLFLF